MSIGRPWVHSFPEKVKQAAAHGFEGIEVFYEDLECLAKEQPGGLTDDNRLSAARIIRELCDQHNLAIITLQSFAFYEGLLDRTQHEAMITKLALWFRLVKILGTTTIQIPTNFAPAATITPDPSS